MILINGKKVSAEICNSLMKETTELKNTTGRIPGLATVLVGEDPASAVYVRNKNKICNEIGFQSFGQNLPAETTESQLLDHIKGLNENGNGERNSCSITTSRSH